MTIEIQKHYRILELEPGSSLNAVRTAWREQVKVWHPDRFTGDPKLQLKAQERLKEINAAYDFLQDFLASKNATEKSDSRSPNSSETTCEQSGKVGESTPQRSSSTPSPSRPVAATSGKPKAAETTTNYAAIFGVLAVVVVLIAIVNSGNNFASRNAAQQTATYYPTISKALDDKNGFKDFKLGMSSKEVRALLPPSSSADQPGSGTTSFSYVATSANHIGDLSIDSIILRFFQDRLYRIELGFSESQNQIYEAFKINFGEPFDHNGWKRGAQTLRAKAWQGQKNSAAILSQPGKDWDSLLLYEMESESKAQEYASKEPERAAKDFGQKGFKSLILGMKIEDLKLNFAVIKDDQVNGTKFISLRFDSKSEDFPTIGYYHLLSVTAEFFNDKLYRINLNLASNQEEIFTAFKQRFGQLTDNTTWTEGSTQLIAKDATSDTLCATILARRDASGKLLLWDTIVLMDTSIWRDADQFKQAAPKRVADRAAKDI